MPALKFKKIEAIEAFPGGPGEAGMPRNMSEMLIRINPDWIDHHIAQETPIGLQLVETIKRGNNAYWFIGELTPQRLNNLLPALLPQMDQWLDTQGRGLGHVVAMAGAIELQGPIRTLFKTEEGAYGALAHIDITGKTAVDLFTHNERWAKHYTFTKKATRDLLLTYVKKDKKPDKDRPFI